MRYLPTLRRAVELVSVVLFTIMFGMFLLQIVGRYTMDQPFGWTVEACVIAYIWIVFWTAAFVVRERDHVTFTILFDIARPATRRVYAIIGAAALLIAFAAAFPGAWDYVTFMKIEKTPVARIRFDYIYVIWLVFMVAVVIRAVLDLKRLLSKDWEREVEIMTEEAPPSTPQTGA